MWKPSYPENRLRSRTTSEWKGFIHAGKRFHDAATPLAEAGGPAAQAPRKAAATEARAGRDRGLGASSPVQDGAGSVGDRQRGARAADEEEAGEADGGMETAQKGPAKIAPPAAAQKPAAAAPLSAEELRLRLSTRSCALGSCETSLLDAQLKRRMINEPVAANRTCEERRRMPFLSASLIRWITDVEAVAQRCGANEAQLIHEGGQWFDKKDYGGTRAAPASRPLLTPHALAPQE